MALNKIDMIVCQLRNSENRFFSTASQDRWLTFFVKIAITIHCVFYLVRQSVVNALTDISFV